MTKCISTAERRGCFVLYILTTKKFIYRGKWKWLENEEYLLLVMWCFSPTNVFWRGSILLEEHSSLIKHTLSMSLTWTRINYIHANQYNNMLFITLSKYTAFYWIFLKNKKSHQLYLTPHCAVHNRTLTLLPVPLTTYLNQFNLPI